MRAGSERGLHEPYYFGLYHWRERGRRLLVGLLAILLAVVAVDRRDRSRFAVALAVPLFLWGGSTAREATVSLLSPPPWVLDREKYEVLAAELPLSEADRLLDVGCGTGRSLVGLGPAVPAACSVVALDVFDDRIILGNGPRLATRNAELAGLDIAAVRGDAARLPLSEGAVDVVTLCRVLHDLPVPAAQNALEEARRVCAPEGTVGVLALPYPHEADADPTAYWQGMVASAGFDVSTVIEREDGYTIVVGDVAGDLDDLLTE